HRMVDEGAIDLDPGRYVEVAVIDTGLGVPWRIQHRIFEPFFSTKTSNGLGRGLGLPAASAAAQQSGGAVRLDASQTGGARFWALWPAAADPLARPTGHSSAPRPGVDAEDLLVAEGEPSTLALLTSILGETGYRVLAARDGVEALEVARRHDGVIDLLLTDLAMPRLDGRQLAMAVAQDRPGIPVLFMSGDL